MSEFKFACPICGQHITADSKDTGSEIPCPTCYRKIVVPQAPSTDDPKFVISASEASKPRPQTSGTQPEGFERRRSKSPLPIGLLVLFVLVCGAAAALVVWHGKLHPKPAMEDASGDASEATGTGNESQPEYTGTNMWTMDLSKVCFPDSIVSGSIHHRAFALERATLTGSNLTFRVGRSGSVELGMSIYFFNRLPEELSGKSAEVKPTDPKAPRVTMHWMENKRKSQTIHSGYAMKIEFGKLENNSLPGKIFICLPDSSKSWVAGEFRAEIHKPGPPKPRRPSSQHESQTQ